MATLIGRNSLCVGATTGIGKAIAIELAKDKSNVAIVGRSLNEGEKTLALLREVYPGGKHAFVACDASVMKNIDVMCNIVKSKYDKLDYCVVSQGTASLSSRTETSDGADIKLALHYYGRIHVIRSMLPLMKRAASQNGDPRVLSVLSGGVHSAYTNFDDLELRKSYSLRNAANAACFYNDLGLDQLARENSEITFIHASPGVVRTRWGHEFPLPLKVLGRMFQYCFAMTPEACGQNMCRVLKDGQFKGGLRILVQTKLAAKLLPAHTDEARATVWAHTLDFLEKTTA